jgi:hypothetical protein
MTAQAAPSRRNFLGLAACAASAASAASAGAMAQADAAQHPDAALLALIGQYNELQRRRIALVEGARSIELEKAREDLVSETFDLQEPILAQIVAMPTKTLEGFQARARMVLLAFPNEIEPDSWDWLERMLYPIIEGLAG